MKTADMSAFFKIGYGLYVVTSHDGTHDNGMICNTVVQVTGEPARLAVTVNKANYTHDVVKASGRMNVCTLAESAPFFGVRKLRLQKRTRRRQVRVVRAHPNGERSCRSSAPLQLGLCADGRELRRSWNARYVHLRGRRGGRAFGRADDDIRLLPRERQAETPARACRARCSEALDMPDLRLRLRRRGAASGGLPVPAVQASGF